MLHILKIRNIVIIDLILAVLLYFSVAHEVFGETTSITAENDGRAYIYAVETYATVRDTSQGNSVSTNLLSVGQWYRTDTTDYYVFRSFASFVIPAMDSAQACTLYVNGYQNNSTTDFEIYIHGAEAYGPEIGSRDYSKFNGRQTGAAHDGTVLNNTWNSSSYSAGWNTLVFNAAGIDSVEAAAGDTLLIALISKEDYDNSAPTDEEYIHLESSEASGEEPYLSIQYLPDIVESVVVRRNRVYNLTRQVLYDNTFIPLWNVE